MTISKSLTLEELSALILKQAKEKGFGTKPDEVVVAEKIALIHTEVSEAYEAYRKKNIDGKDGFSEELADIIIRTIHLAAIHSVDIGHEVKKKLKHNKSRTWNWEDLNETSGGQ